VTNVEPTPTLGGPPEPARPPRWLLYVDLDAFYVACELRDRPELRGRPVIVGPPPSSGPTRGVVLSASYEARAFGIHSAQPAVAAQRLCPDAVWIPPDFAKYGRVSEEALGVLRRHARVVVPYSIDEAVVVPDALSAEAAAELGRAIQRELASELGLSASVGVSTSRVVAKMASDRAKPGRLLVVPPDEVAGFVAPLPVRAIPGVGPKTEETLAARGIRTVGDLAGRRPSDLLRDLGGFARELIALARGSPLESLEIDPGPRSRSADHTFDRDADRWEEVLPVVVSLAEELGASVDREGLRYGSVGVAFRWADFERTQRSRTLPAAREGPTALREAAVYLARHLWAAEEGGRARPIRTVSVRVERLAGRARHQASLEEFDPRARSGVK
jgi:nucleotidyltransferase/DNA polymerase involved in DNA repair